MAGRLWVCSTSQQDCRKCDFRREGNRVGDSTKRRHWSWHCQRSFRFRVHSPWWLFRHWNSTISRLHRTLCNSSNAHDWRCHCGRALRTVHTREGLAWNTVQWVVCFWLAVRATAVTFLFSVLLIRRFSWPVLIRSIRSLCWGKEPWKAQTNRLVQCWEVGEVEAKLMEVSEVLTFRSVTNAREGVFPPQ